MAGAGLVEIADQKESMGICFIGKRALGHFLNEYIEESKDSVTKVLVNEDGSVCDIGRHDGQRLQTCTIKRLAQRLGSLLPADVCHQTSSATAWVLAAGPGLACMATGRCC